MSTRRFHADEPDLDRFLAEVAEADLQPLWTQKGLMPGTPPIRDVPHLWRWKVLRHLAETSGQLVPIDRGGDRRVLSLSNPGLDGAPFATSTLWGAVQFLGPHEVAPPHRHTPSALRFVLEGRGVWTLVDNDPIVMEPGDLVLTPSTRWHEHHNSGDTPMIWFDGLDMPLVRALDAVFYEDGGDEVTSAVDAASRSELRYGSGAGIVPVGERPPVPHSPLLVYRWADTDRALERQGQTSGADTEAVRFVDPTTGQDVMPTLRCEMQRISGGARSPGKRETGSSIYVTFRGGGTADIGSERFTVEQGDMFVVPSWNAFSFSADEPTDLFRVTDAPVLEVLGLYRSEDVDPEVAR